LSLFTISTFAIDPSVETATAIRPGTPQLPPAEQAREPGGLLMALASNPPMANRGLSDDPVAMRKKEASSARAARPKPKANATSMAAKARRPRERDGGEHRVASDPDLSPCT